MDTNAGNDDWRGKEPTGKQKQAIFNMEHALGCTEYSNPKTRGEACVRITELKKVISHNLMVGGSINARHSPLLYGSGWDGFQGEG